MVRFKQETNEDVVKFCNKIMPWTEYEIESAIQYFHQAGLTVDNLIRTIENRIRGQYEDEPLTPHQQIDIQKEAHNHVFFMAVAWIKHTLNYDMMLDRAGCASTQGHGNFLNHYYEPTTLQKRIDYATEEQINELRKDTATMAFLSHNGHKIKVNA